MTVYISGNAGGSSPGATLHILGNTKIPNEGSDMWVARDMGGDLFLYIDKPTRNNRFGEWGSENVHLYLKIDYDLFSTLKWEDEPLEVKLVAKEV